MTHRSATPGRTVAEVALAAGCSERFARELLRDLRRQGLVVSEADRWRLTEAGEEFGQALREAGSGLVPARSEEPWNAR